MWTEIEQGLVDEYRSAVRASVERGDWRLPVGRTVKGCYTTGLSDAALAAALALIAEADPPEAVAADPEVLDTQADGNYSHGVTHALKSDGRTATGESAPRASQHRATPPSFTDVGLAERRGGRAAPASVEAGSTPATHDFDRAGWLARVQRIDPRVRRP